MDDAVGCGSPGDPTEEEIAAALAAVRLLLRRRAGHSGGGARWLRTGRAEAVLGLPHPVSWATAERPQ